MDHCFIYTFEHGCYKTQLYKRNYKYLYKYCVKIKDYFKHDTLFSWVDFMPSKSKVKCLSTIPRTSN